MQTSNTKRTAKATAIRQTISCITGNFFFGFGGVMRYGFCLTPPVSRETGRYPDCGWR